MRTGNGSPPWVEGANEPRAAITDPPSGAGTLVYGATSPTGVRARTGLRRFLDLPTGIGAKTGDVESRRSRRTVSSLARLAYVARDRQHLPDGGRLRPTSASWSPHDRNCDPASSSRTTASATFRSPGIKLRTWPTEPSCRSSRGSSPYQAARRSCALPCRPCIRRPTGPALRSQGPCLDPTRGSRRRRRTGLACRAVEG
jgi:hypothetical protein